jgi:uncharacterized membrane protein YjgN (DUF898 family)
MAETEITPANEREGVLEFKGQAAEYFRIWIVNVFLTIITLGIYSAWAKVRNKRYFYGNTFLEGSSFEYLADPVAILKGRVIAVAAFAVYSGVTAIMPLAAPLFALVFFLLTPWIVMRAMMFNARYSAYRNIRFGYEGSYGDVAKVFIGIALLIPLTLGLIYPSFVHARNRLLISFSRYGMAPFSFEAKEKSFYGVYLKALGFYLLMIGGWVALMSLVQPSAPVLVPEDINASAKALAGFVASLFLMVGMLLLYAFIQARITNLVWNNVALEAHRFHSNLLASRLAWIYISNSIAIIFSLGLLIPWTRIRIARYRIENTGVSIKGSLDDYVSAQKQRLSSTGEEMGELFDVDISL